MVTIEYVREDEKKHSVRYVECEGPVGQEHLIMPQHQVLGTIYVKRSSGLTNSKRLRVTIEEVKE